jgi:hypothetical protein
MHLLVLYFDLREKNIDSQYGPCVEPELLIKGLNQYHKPKTTGAEPTIIAR